MRIVSSLIVAAFTAVAPALAGDTAELNILGFSGDGRIFAFEEYGVQDGSGFPYAHRFYIDTATDRFVSGSPVRVRLDDEAAGVEQARAEAKRKGERIVRDAVLAANRGYTAGANAIGEMNADFSRMVVNPRPVFPMIDDALEFRLDEKRVPEQPRCGGEEVVGLRALRIAAEDGGATETLFVDGDKIPLSRGCPLHYRIAAVQTAWPDAGEPVYALVIAVERIGFEGPDFRYIAITGRIEP